MKRSAIVSAAVLFVLLAAAGLVNQQPDRALTATSFGTTPFGFKAIYDLLRESEVPVSRNLARFAELPERATVWWIAPHSLCGPDATPPPEGGDEAWSGAEWLARGGTAVVFLPPGIGPPACARVAGTAIPARARLEAAPAPNSSDVAAAKPEVADSGPAPRRKVAAARLGTERVLSMLGLEAFDGPKDWTVAAEAEGRPFILERPVGEGRLVVVGDTQFVSNAGLDKGDAAPLAMDLVRAYGPPLIDERDHGFGGSGGTWAYLWGSSARTAFLGLAVLGLLVAWWGAALPPRTAGGESLPAPTLEGYVSSVATLYARARDHAAVAARYRDFILRQLRRRNGWPPDTPAEAVIDRLRHRRILDAAEAGALRAAPSIRSSAELQRHAQRLDDILRKATP